MNRELRFRAWDEIEKEMIYMNFGMLATGAYYIDESNPIMQYTGLVDSEGVEIFEGDIVKSCEGYIQQILWKDNSWKTFFKVKKSYQGEAYTEDLYNNINNDASDKRWGYKIIGNIYENKSLSEVEK